MVQPADNKVRDESMNTIKVNINRETSEISVYNNGRGIPVEMHSKEKIYVPELIFGHLLTSSNYDDREEKVTGGRNGFGAKLCNIFSKSFEVETADSVSGKKFKQVFTNNMSEKGTPKITSNGRGEDYTKITFKPDLEKFNLECIDEDFYALLSKRVIDLAGCVRGVKVFLNDERIKIKDFKGYVELYLKSSELSSRTPIIYERINERWEVAFTSSEGGTHVAAIADQMAAQLIEAVKKKDKKGIPLRPYQIKSHLWVFVNCSIVNPTFDSQTKETMTLRPSAFGSKCPLSEDFMKKVLKSGVVDTILSFAKFKQEQIMKKTDGAANKRTRITGLTKLDDANNAGSKNASQCTLILTEGDSAKSLAVSGLSVVGRDNFGVFPLRGKLLNVREASHTQIVGNAEINAIKQILGLQHGKVYHDLSSLRYGHLMIMTDQDHDGSHIKGLIINFFDHFWPSLLKIPGFLLEFITPIVKATKGKNAQKKEVSFFTIPEYEAWKEENDNGRGWGLGTSTTEDAKKYFSDLPKHLKPFEVATEESRALIDMAFNKKKADDRKEWLRGFQVAQLAGYVSEHSAYHHGEVSLCMTIVNMAQSYVGSNNLNLLEPLGQFGTRLQGGKDAASPRYIFTNLSTLARTIFHPSDDALLNYLNDDGQSIEPEWYLPIIPMLLVFKPDCLFPRDIVDNIYRMMRGEEMVPMTPWYRGFEGTIKEEGSSRYRVTGNITQLDSTTVEITELPIRNWTQSYKEQLEAWIVGTEKNPAWIKEYKEYHTDCKVHFVITVSEQTMKEALKEGLEKGRIKKYDDAVDVVKDFFELRQKYYHKRKDHLLAELNADHLKIDNRVRFVMEIIEGTLIVQNRKKSDLLATLKASKYDPIYKSKASNNSDEEVETNEHGYDYLLSMPIWNLTMEKVQQLIKEKEQKEEQIKLLLGQTPIDLWRTDLDSFLAQWDAFETEMKELESVKPNNKTQANKRGPQKRTIDQMFKKKAVVKSDDDEEFEVTTKKVRAKVEKTVSAASKKKAKVSISDDDDVIDVPVTKSKPAAKKATSQPVKTEKKSIKRVVSTSDEDNFEVAPTARKRTRSSSSAESISSDVVAAKQPRGKASQKTALKQSTMKSFFAKKGSDSDDVSIPEPPQTESAPKKRVLGGKKATTAKAPKAIEKTEDTKPKDVFDFPFEKRKGKKAPPKKVLQSDSDEDHTVVSDEDMPSSSRQKKSSKVVVSDAESVEVKKPARRARAVKKVTKLISSDFSEPENDKSFVLLSD
ncbi:DNA topoisomerase 2 [Globomyces sp. JEL0801]|nr:DNA topoisomerase 2 [Globomyces sp. JEL0801]